jgi:hypothetical protein
MKFPELHRRLLGLFTRYRQGNREYVQRCLDTELPRIIAEIDVTNEPASVLALKRYIAYFERAKKIVSLEEIKEKIAVAPSRAQHVEAANNCRYGDLLLTAKKLLKDHDTKTARHIFQKIAASGFSVSGEARRYLADLHRH